MRVALSQFRVTPLYDWMNGVSTFLSKPYSIWIGTTATATLSAIIYCAIICMCNNSVGLDVWLRCLPSSLSSCHLFNIFTDFPSVIRSFPVSILFFFLFIFLLILSLSIPFIFAFIHCRCVRKTLTKNDESNINTLPKQTQFYSMLHELLTNPMRLTNTAIRASERIIYIIWQ